MIRDERSLVGLSSANDMKTVLVTNWATGDEILDKEDFGPSSSSEWAERNVCPTWRRMPEVGQCRLPEEGSQ